MGDAGNNGFKLRYEDDDRDYWDYWDFPWFVLEKV